MTIRILATLMLALAPAATAAVPTVIPYHGRVSVEGTPFTGSGQFRFALTNEDGSHVHWKNNTIDLPVTANVIAGEFEIAVGNAAIPNMADIPFAVFDNSPLYLRVWFDDGVNGEHELAPATRLLAVPFAIMAKTVEDGAVTTDKIADGAVMPGKIGMGAVGSAQIFPGAVQSTHLGNAAVGGINLAPSAVGTPALADASVTTPKLADNAVTTAKIYPEAVGTAQLAPFAVGSGQIVNGAISDQKIANGAVTTHKIPDRSIPGVKLQTGAVNTTELADESVTAAKLAPGAVGANALDPTGLQSALDGIGFASGLPGSLAISEDPESEELLGAGYRRIGVIRGERASFTYLNGDPTYVDEDTAIPNARSNAYIIPSRDGFSIWGGWGKSFFSYMVPESNSIGVDGRGRISWNATSPVPGAPPASTRGCHIPIHDSRYFTWGGFTMDGGQWIPLASGGSSLFFGSWQIATALDAPEPRGFHTAVWTGEQVLVYGGCNGNSSTNDAPVMNGDRFNDIHAWAPGGNTWTRLRAEVEHSDGRAGHHAIWTGTEMLVWGGRDQNGSNLANGFAYHPVTDISRPLSTTGAPEATIHQAVVWTGSKMLVASLYPATTTLQIHHYDIDHDQWSLALADTSWECATMSGQWDGAYLILASKRTSGFAVTSYHAYHPDFGTLAGAGTGIPSSGSEFQTSSDFGWNGRQFIQLDYVGAVPYRNGSFSSANTADLYLYKQLPPEQ